MRKLDLTNVEEFTDYKSPKAGGYICAVAKVEDITDKEYLKIYYDIVEGEFKGYYTNLKKEGVFKDYPYFFASYKDSALKFFKGTVTAFEKSNKGYKFDYDESKLKGKKVGLVLFEEEYEKNNGTVGVSLKVDKAHSVDAIKSGDFKVPDRVAISQSVSSTSAKSSSPFDNIGNKPDASSPFVDEKPSEESVDEKPSEELDFMNIQDDDDMSLPF